MTKVYVIFEHSNDTFRFNKRIGDVVDVYMSKETAEAAKEALTLADAARAEESRQWYEQSKNKKWEILFAHNPIWRWRGKSGWTFPPLLPRKLHAIYMEWHNANPEPKDGGSARRYSVVEFEAN